ncbi:deoxyribonuclease IV [Candidatus Woesebacteria bacterium]|nr:deoxyribonuclease IV [Candidatus Woesebacteria bacterium]
MNHRIGAHLSTSGGYHKALEQIVHVGGNCLQIFSSSPRTWQSASPHEDTITRFGDLKKQLHIDSVYFHALYLVNLADDAATGEKSVRALTSELCLAQRMGVKGSVIHTGSFKSKNKDVPLSCHDEKNYPILLAQIKSVLRETPPETLLILENAGTRKIGQTIEQLSEIITDVDDKRVRVCLDTCHLHAAGYDLRSPKDFDHFLTSFDALIGLEKLEVVHLNDSRDPFNSLRDRHENIGKGNVGIEVFQNFLNHQKTKHLPFILETPGFDGNGPDKENIDILKSLTDMSRV